MNHKSKSIFVILLTFICICSIHFTTYAQSISDGSSSSSTIVFDDGAYMTDEIQIYASNNSISFASASHTKTAARTYTYYDKNKKKCWALTLSATFEYNNSTSKALNASTSYTIFANGWKCTSSNKSCSGNTAKATATFKHLAKSVNTQIGLKCSPSGTITQVN